MICPNKFTPLDKSILGKVGHLMMDPGSEISLVQLRETTAKNFVDVGEFIFALDTLFALGKVELDGSRGVISYVE
ncbi:ABC-three component system middle component 7 [Falsiruegeria litorea]|uniref:ABC-three component system middle component 7 n=1 Tax=Falsiruegeria litorea TaxID=1280831 RepID=UPI0033368A73